MIVKGLALTALVASTPLAMFAAQEPAPARQGDGRAPAARSTDTVEGELRRANTNLVRARAELAAAQEDVRRLQAQLEAALDRIDASFEPERDRNCSPSRGRALMSHYQWLRDQGHGERAGGALARVVEQIGDDRHRLNSAAWELMTEKQTAGKFDDVALAIVQRMEAGAGEPRRLDPNHLDTMALAHFLNGNAERAVELQREAIERGGRGDDFRRRLRTYEAAQQAVAKAQRAATATVPGTLIADEED